MRLSKNLLTIAFSQDTALDKFDTSDPSKTQLGASRDLETGAGSFDSLRFRQSVMLASGFLRLGSLAVKLYPRVRLRF